MPAHPERWGSGSGDGSAGCCTSCCKRSFDDDEFEKEETRLREQREAREAAEAQAGASNGIITTQPVGEKGMTDTRAKDHHQADDDSDGEQSLQPRTSRLSN